MAWRFRKIAIDIGLIIAVIILSFTINDNIHSVMGDIKEEQPIYSVDTEEKTVSLTFDINWAEKDNLESILNILDKYNVKGTFFIMGGWVNYSEDNINKLIEINKRGNEIGNHSYMHPGFTKITFEKMKEELKKTDDIIEKYTGKKPELFRFPSGEYNKDCFEKVRGLGYTCIQWDTDSVDWKELGADVEYNRVMKKVKPGSIMLFHNNAKYTPENLEKIINELQKQGYVFKPVGEMIYKNDYTIDEQGIQHKNI
ncbi:polysaccharide deacetylase family protein [Clostridium butyricum]|uniref:polysaccharide deacetylase family protein n=1 Tax=Clostridium butyricum TaxID=1492 RepID=UPI000413F7E4|nr:polysaccharide deacetylase family protein [Clostridium butyricum]MBZ0311411.1 polysaccharide deacetylase family protein [Clostridium butyricum]MDU5722664.1 polysaccharide deacetylase family protein [Clostridium butyricum]MDU5820861.1 polysaccharide deacetylase family protein [Clostridium butyricum]